MSQCAQEYSPCGSASGCGQALPTSPAKSPADRSFKLATSSAWSWVHPSTARLEPAPRASNLDLPGQLELPTVQGGQPTRDLAPPDLDVADWEHRTSAVALYEVHSAPVLGPERRPIRATSEPSPTPSSVRTATGSLAHFVAVPARDLRASRHSWTVFLTCAADSHSPIGKTGNDRT